MRTWLRSKISLLFMTLGLLVAIPAVAFAADLVSDVNADLSSSVSTPTWVGANADKTFQIKVWAVGNYNNINTPDRTGAVEVVKNYETFLNTTWQTRPGSSGNGTVLATDKETINFEQGLTDAGYSLSSLSNFNYTSDCPTTGTVPKGCQANPFVITGKLHVGNVPNNTSMTLTDDFGTTSPGFEEKGSSLDSGFVKVDAAKPTITLTTPANNATYNADQSVTASYSCADSGSGIKATGGCVGTVANGSAIDTSSPGSKSFTVTATDNVGNVETVTRNYTVVNPNTAPELTVPADKTVEATKAADADVTYTVSAQDAQDGDLTSEVECSPASGNTFPLGTTTVNCSVTDSGGLSDSGSFTVTVVDTTPPNIANHDDITAEATGPGGAHVDYTEPDATDAVDGNVSVTCTPASGSLFSAGTTPVNCEATDAHNNKATGSFTVTVNYGWTVFFQPIDNNPDQSGDPTKATIWNSAKAGQAIPIKFNLSGNQGLSILATKNDLGVATAYPRSVKVTCPGATYPVDAIETYSSSTAAGLLYDPIADQYIYNWKTATSLANSCQMLDLKLADGTHHYAFFKFTK